MENENLGVNSLEPEEYFEMKLWKGSEDFLMLNKLVEESRGEISWDDLKKYTRIENEKVEWIYREGDLSLWWTNIESLWKLKEVRWDLNLEWVGTLKDLWELKKVWGALYLMWTNIESLWRLKIVWWNLYLTWVGTLKDLWELEEVWWDLYWEKVGILKDLWELKKVWGALYLMWTNIESLWKLQRVWWALDLSWVGTLKDLWKLEEVWWDLDLRWTSVDVQLEVIRKINEWGLQVEDDIYFWWDVDNIKKLLDMIIIPWVLDLRRAGIEIQLEAWKRRKGKELIVEELYVSNTVEIFEVVLGGNLERGFKKLKETYGDRIDKIRDSKVKSKVEEVLRWILEIKRKRIAEKIKWVLEDKKLTDKKKIEAILELGEGYEKLKQKLEWYGISLDNT